MIRVASPNEDTSTRSPKNKDDCLLDVITLTDASLSKAAADDAEVLMGKTRKFACRTLEWHGSCEETVREMAANLLSGHFHRNTLDQFAVDRIEGPLK
jgi:hypothetical protein